MGGALLHKLKEAQAQMEAAKKQLTDATSALRFACSVKGAHGGRSDYTLAPSGGDGTWTWVFTQSDAHGPQCVRMYLNDDILEKLRLHLNALADRGCKGEDS